MNDFDNVTWVLEADVFPASHSRMLAAVRDVSAEAVLWRDEWLADESWPRLSGRVVIFHGSLGNAAVVAERLPWRPGSFCDAQGFRCSRWYPRADRWLLHRTWALSSVEELATTADDVLARIGAPEAFFVRPDSPLKPFSGRVLQRDQISLAALDYGFYYEDKQLPVIVAPVRAVHREWRYVVVAGEVVAGSAYQANGRSSLPDEPSGEPWAFASAVARQIDAPQDVLVLDVCEADGGLFLLEINPFGGADLYACDRVAVVAAVSRFATRSSQQGA
jgi:ATP-grasp domain, R2K clade family 3